MIRKTLGEFSSAERKVFEGIVSIKTFNYRLIGFGHKKVEMMHDFMIGSIGFIRTSSPKLMEWMWSLDSDPLGEVLLIIYHGAGPTCVLKKNSKEIWQGTWLAYDQMPVELSPDLPPVSESDCKHYQYLQEQAITSIPAYPASRFKGRGVVIPGGGLKYFPCAWVCINMLRNVLNCNLPIELWYLGEREMDEHMIAWMEELKVECINAMDFLEIYPVRRLNGWELKPYAIIHSRFEEVIFIDADNVPLIDPVALFDQEPYQQTGAIFWPDYGRLGPERAIWKICDLIYQDEPEFETGQMVLHKEKVWNALQLTMHYNEHSEFYYRYVNGDKETFHMAWRKLNLDYSMPAFPLFPLTDTMCQHDFDRNIIFQHRNMDKWNLSGPNKRIEGFVHETACLGFLEKLRIKWLESI